jgi:hypothetical protein
MRCEARAVDAPRLLTLKLPFLLLDLMMLVLNQQSFINQQLKVIKSMG